MSGPGPKSVGCAKCCAVFSMSGVVFCLMIGAILQSQPLFVLGVDDPSKASKSCYGAAGIYVGCIFLSLGVLLYDKITPEAEYKTPLAHYDNLPPGLGERETRLPLRANRQAIELSPQGQML